MRKATKCHTTIENVPWLALRSALWQFPSFAIPKSNLSKARVVISTYNQHIGFFLPSLLVGFGTTTFTRVRGADIVMESLDRQ